MKILMSASHGGFGSERVPLGGGAAIFERLARHKLFRNLDLTLLGAGNGCPPDLPYEAITSLQKAPSSLGVMEYDIPTLENGLDTVVSPRGVKLSGGQIQRAATARMFVRPAQLYVFDDLSSALDVDTERILWERLFSTRQQTCLVVSHRRPALQRADRIILLKDGEIVQIGKPEDILTNPADDYVARFIEGVDMSRILTARSAMRPVRATAREDDGPRTVLHKLSENSLDSIYVTSRDRKLLGLIEADAADRAAREGVQSIKELIHDDFPKVGPDEPLHNLFAMFNDKSYPIAVIDADQRLLGVVVKGAVLAELAEAGEH